MDPITSSLAILSALMAGGVTLMIFSWRSLKKAYAVNDHTVPWQSRLAIFGIGCCTLAAPLYVMVHLISTL